MINNNFDDFVQHKLAATRPTVPSYIWDNIAAKKRTKKPLAFWWSNAAKLMVASILLIGALVTYFFINKNDLSKTNKTTAQSISPKSDLNNNNKNTPIIKLNIPLVTKPLNNTNNFYFSTNKSVVEKNNIEYDNDNSKEDIEPPFNDYVVNKMYNSADLLSFKNNFNPLIKKPILPHTNIIPCPSLEKNTAGNKTYVEIYAAPDFVFTTEADTANSSYKKQRNESSKILSAYSVGLRYTKVFGSGMSIRTGINYSHINESYTAKTGTTVQNVYIINNNGDTTGTYSSTTTQFKKSTNKYNSIDVPIVVGYEFGNGKLHTNINAGAIVNIVSKQKGFVLDNNGNEINLAYKNQQSVYQYKTNAGVSAAAAISVYYKLTDNLHIMAEPYLRYSLTPITKPDITYSKKYHTSGVKLGLRVDF